MILNELQKAQYDAVRNAAGAWLCKQSSLISITGEDRYTWLQGMISNDITLLSSGSATRLPACFLDATGHLLADAIITDTRTETGGLLVELPVSERDSMLQLLDKYLITEEVTVDSVDLLPITVQGPGSGHVMEEVFDTTEIMYYAADHTGSGGFDIYMPASDTAELIEKLTAAGAVQIDDEVQNLLRIEAGIPLYGVDMDRTVIALEAGLGLKYISFTKGCYVGQEIIARIDSRGHTNRELTGLIVVDGPLPADGAVVSYAGEGNGEARDTGRITSVAAYSPACGGRPIALGYVRHEHRDPGTRLTAGQAVLETVELPFWRG